MTGAVEKAEEIAREKGYFQPMQFANSANPEIHRRTTAQEILNDLGRVDIWWPVWGPVGPSPV